MRLSAACTSTPRRLTTEAKNIVKCRRSLRQVWWYFFLFSCSVVYTYFSEFLDWQETA